MSRNLGPKIKQSRRFGQDLGHKQNAQKVARRITVLPGQHGKRGRRRVSDFGLQLAEKQKVKFIYGVTEKQLHRYMKEAQRNPKATGEEFLRILERRLDNVVYRLGFAPTRPLARQLVGHGHVRINNRSMTIPSYRAAVGDVITLSPTSLNIPDVKKKIEDETYQTPAWMQKKAAAGTISRFPKKEELSGIADEQLIVEYYSR